MGFSGLQVLQDFVHHSISGGDYKPMRDEKCGMKTICRVSISLRPSLLPKTAQPGNANRQKVRPGFYRHYS